MVTGVLWCYLVFANAHDAAGALNGIPVRAARVAKVVSAPGGGAWYVFYPIRAGIRCPSPSIGGGRDG